MAKILNSEILLICITNLREKALLFSVSFLRASEVDKEETQPATVSLSATEEISMDAAVPAFLAELEEMFQTGSLEF